MFSNNQMAASRGKSRYSGFFFGLLAMVSVVMVLSASAEAASNTPVVGSVVSNQASASYTDGSGAVKTATSNLVTTTITQVANLNLVTDNSKTVVAGSTAYMPHTLTNLGNGPDTFTFTINASTTPFALTSTALYLDANADGVPDSSTPLCSSTGTPMSCSSFVTPSLPAGGTYSFVLAEQVPITAASGAANASTITAKSVLDTTQTKTNTDTVTVTSGPAFNVSKSISTPTGLASPASCTTGAEASCIKVKYTLTYTNTGAAGNLYLKDIIGTAGTAGMLYVPSSAKWSVGAASLTDATASETAANIDYQAVAVGTGASAVTTIETVIANVPTGFSGTVSFDVTIKPTAAIGTSQTTNSANYGISTTPTVGTPPTTTNPTNPSAYTVGNSYGVVVNNTASDSTVGVVDAVPTATATPSTDANLVFITGASTTAANTAAPGTTVSFENYVYNTGSGIDTFNVAVSAITAFPSGTVFQLFQQDGLTPLADSNADGIPDTGPLTPSATTPYKVVVKAIIPAAACSASACPSNAGYTEMVTATSITDASKLNKSYDRLESLTTPTVDLTNSAAGTASDLGPYASTSAPGTPTTTNSIASGGTTAFPLFIKNSGLAADNYNLEFSTSNFASGTVPAGWTIVFKKTDADSTAAGGACTTGAGSVITNSGNVPASGGQVQVCAFITTPASAPAGTSNLFFRATSGATGASDIKLDAVTILANPKISLTPNGSGQVYPGGSVVYPHVLTNSGNTSCAGDFGFTLSNVLSGWSAIVYDDANGNGVIDAGEAVLGSHNGTTFTAGANLASALALNATHKLLVKVLAPAGASNGDTDNITVQVVDNATVTSCGTATANDGTLVITGQLRLDKLQAKADCLTGALAAPLATTALAAAPGDCLVYQVTATNAGTTDVSAVTVSDNIPSFTSYQSTAAPFACTSGALVPASPSTGYVGSLSCGPIATMVPGATATMTFGVRVNP